MTDRLRLFAGAVLALVSLSSCIGKVATTNPYDPEMPAEQQQKAALKGVVYGERADGSGQDRLLGAVVGLEGPSDPPGNPAITASDGAFELTGLTPGIYTIDVTHAQFLRHGREVTLEPGEERELEVVLDAGVAAAEQAHLAGEAHKSTELSQPLAVQDHSGIVVEVEGLGIRTVTSPSGAFDLFLAAGTYNLLLSATSHATARRDGVLATPGETTVVPDSPVVLVANPGSVSGTVQLEGAGDGQHGDAIVSLAGGPTTTSAADGTFVINGVAPGPYILTAAKVGLDTVTLVGVDVVGGRDTSTPTLELQISRGAITGLVTMVGRTDHGGVSVSLAGTTYAVSSVASGAFIFEGVRVGTYDVVANRYGYRQGIANGVVVTSGAATNLAAPLVLAIQQGDFEISGGASYTNQSLVTLTLDVASAAYMKIVGDVAVPDTDFSRPYSTDPQVTLSDTDGLKVIEIYYQDTVGGESGPFSGSIVLDTAPPSLASIVIDGGATWTNEASGLVQLQIMASDALSGVAEMQLSLDTVFDETWEPLTTPKLFQLGTAPIVDGAKTVYVRVRDGAGNPTPEIPTPASDTITLDRQDPILAELNLGCHGVSPVTICNSPLVDLTIDAAGADFMAFSSQPGVPVEAWEPWGPTRTYLVTSGDGSKDIYMKLMDLAGNKTSAVSASFTLDTTPPTAAVSLNAGAPRTNSRTVALTGTASEAVVYAWGSDAVDCMSASFTGTLSTLINTPSAALIDEEGTRTLEVCLRDEAGNTHLVRDTIVLDKTGPGGQLLVAGGAAFTKVTPASVTFTNFASDVTSAYLTVDALSACSTIASGSWGSFATSLPVALSGGDGLKTVRGCLRDDVGNTTLLTPVSITLDTTPPTWSAPVIEARARTGYTTSGGSDLIADGGSTTDPMPRVTWSGATDAYGTPLTYELQFSSVATFTSPELRGAGPNPPAELSQGTWYYRVVAIDQAQNATPSASRSLTVDRAPPLQPTILGLPAYANAPFTVQWSPGSADTDSYRFILLRGTTEVVNVVLSATSRTLLAGELPASAGTLYTVKVVPIDLLDNEGFPATGAFTYDTQAPCESGTPTIAVNGGATWTNSPTVTVVVTCAGATPTHMRVNCNGTLAGSEALVPYATIFVCALSAGDATKTIDLGLYDAAGNLRAVTERAIGYDGTPPAAPTLTPANVISANAACARILPSGTVDTNFSKWQARRNGTEWADATLVSSKIDFGLLQDTDNFLEVRAVDLAGNVGASSVAFVNEASSALVPTSLTLKQVCNNGQYAILRDTQVYPQVMAAPFAAAGSASVVHLGTPQISLLDLASLQVIPLSGEGGLASQVGTFFNAMNPAEDVRTWHKVSDAACAVNDPRLLIFFVDTNANGDPDDEYGHEYSFIIPDPIANPIDTSSPMYGPLGNWEQSSGTAVGVVSIDVVNWWNATESFEALVVGSTLALFIPTQQIRKIEYNGVTPTVRNSYYSAVLWRPREVFGLGFFGTNAIFMVNNSSGSSWDISRSTTYGDAGSVVYSIPYAAGYSQDVTPWGSLAQQGYYDHMSNSVNFFNNVAVAGSDGAVLSYYVSASGSVSIAAGAPANPPFFQRGYRTLGWVDQANPNAFIMSDTYTSTTKLVFRYEIDTKRPMFPTRISAAGQPRMVYHNAPASGVNGVVVGYDNETLCVGE